MKEELANAKSNLAYHKHAFEELNLQRNDGERERRGEKNGSNAGSKLLLTKKKIERIRGGEIDE